MPKNIHLENAAAAADVLLWPELKRNLKINYGLEQCKEKANL